MAQITNERSADKATSGGLRRWLRGLFKAKATDTSLRESIEDVLKEHASGAQPLPREQRRMFLNIASFGELRVDDVMVPRADIVAVDENTSLDELLEIFRSAAHSRLPVYREALDDPIGMIHIKDVLSAIARQRERERNQPSAGESDEIPESQRNSSIISRIRRKVLFVPPSMPAVDLFLKMQTSRIHMALVIDEYGGTDGLVTIEDLVEEIVGDIEDEHDIAEGPVLKPRDEGIWDVSARAPLEELEEELGADLVPEEREEDVDTLGGLVVALAGRVPQRGELIALPGGYELEVVDADPRRLKWLRLYRLAARPQKQNSDSDKTTSTSKS